MMLLEILAVILMAAPTAVESFLDIRNYRKGRPDKKKGRDAAIRIGGMLAAGVIASFFTDKTWWQGTILSGGIFILTFDYLMAWGMSKRLDYLGTTSHIDRFLRDFHWPIVLFWRGIIFASAATTYYDLHKVLYGNF